MSKLQALDILRGKNVPDTSVLRYASVTSNDIVDQNRRNIMDSARRVLSERGYIYNSGGNGIDVGDIVHTHKGNTAFSDETGTVISIGPKNIRVKTGEYTTELIPKEDIVAYIRKKRG